MPKIYRSIFGIKPATSARRRSKAGANPADRHISGFDTQASLCPEGRGSVASSLRLGAGKYHPRSRSGMTATHFRGNEVPEAPAAFAHSTGNRSISLRQSAKRRVAMTFVTQFLISISTNRGDDVGVRQIIRLVVNAMRRCLALCSGLEELVAGYTGHGQLSRFRRVDPDKPSHL